MLQCLAGILQHPGTFFLDLGGTRSIAGKAEIIGKYDEVPGENLGDPLNRVYGKIFVELIESQSGIARINSLKNTLSTQKGSHPYLARPQPIDQQLHTAPPIDRTHIYFISNDGCRSRGRRASSRPDILPMKGTDFSCRFALFHPGFIPFLHEASRDAIGHRRYVDRPAALHAGHDGNRTVHGVRILPGSGSPPRKEMLSP
jgi:hypothetical protein